MNIVLVNPVASTPDVSFRSLAMPAVPTAMGRPALQQVNIVELGAAFADLGHPTTVVIGAPFLDGKEIRISDRLRVQSVGTVLHVPFHPGVLPMTPELVGHLVFRDADVVQTGEFHQPATFFASRACREHDIPMVVWQETFAPMRPPGAYYQRLYEILVGGFVDRTAKRFVPRTTKARDYLIRLGVDVPRITEWIPTGINAGVFSPDESLYLPEDFGWDPDSQIVLVVARLHPSKGVDTAIRILKRIAREEPTARLVVRGTGPELAALRRLAIQLGVFDRTRIVGRLSRQDMVHLYNLASVVLGTSRVDLLPFSLIEASSCGRPCVSTEAGAVRDIVVNGETGFVVAPGNEESLARAVLALLRDPDLRASMGAAARARVESRFALPKVAQRLLGVYRASES